MGIDEIIVVTGVDARHHVFIEYLVLTSNGFRDSISPDKRHDVAHETSKIKW